MIKIPKSIFNSNDRSSITTTISDMPTLVWVNDINEANAKLFVEQIMKIDSSKNQDVIPIFIDSSGGEVYSLLSILNAMQACIKPIATVAIGKAMSCGAILLTCGTKGLRFAGEHSVILIHEVFSHQWGKTQDVLTETTQVNKLNDKLLEILAKNTKFKSITHIKTLLKKRSNTDWYMTADEALEWGLIDEINIPVIIPREEKFNDFIIPPIGQNYKEQVENSKTDFVNMLHKMQRHKDEHTVKARTKKPTVKQTKDKEQK